MKMFNRFLITAFGFLDLFRLCGASCLRESELTVGPQEGEPFSNKDELMLLDADLWRLYGIETCEDY